MNSAGQNGEKMRYRVILLLVVGLAAFSSAMKELNQVQQFALDTSRLIAQVSHQLTPPQIPQNAEITHTAAKVESCESKQSLPTVELPWLAHVEEETTIEPTAVKPRRSREINIKKNLPEPSGFEFQFAKTKKLTQIDINPVQFEVRISEDHDSDQDGVVISELPVTPFKAKNRRNGAIRINPRDREVLLKTLNRSINLRIAS